MSLSPQLLTPGATVTPVPVNSLRIVELEVHDLRFPTSLTSDGSDASHPDPDYSAVYVRLVTNDPSLVGCGMSFTLGRGNELVKHAVDSLRFLVIGRFVEDIQGTKSLIRKCSNYIQCKHKHNGCKQNGNVLSRFTLHQARLNKS